MVIGKKARPTEKSSNNRVPKVPAGETVVKELIGRIGNEFSEPLETPEDQKQQRGDEASHRRLPYH
jgi:hypothetical protein